MYEGTWGTHTLQSVSEQRHQSSFLLLHPMQFTVSTSQFEKLAGYLN